MAYYKYSKEAQSEATPSNFQPFLRNVPKGKDGKEKYYNIPSDKSSDNNSFRILPPWSKEGLFAKVKKIHSYIGVNSVSLVCPDTEEEGSCLFCNAAAKIRNEEKFKIDWEAIHDKIRAVFNVVDAIKPELGGLIFSTYSRPYFTIKKFQDSGEYGDITDIFEGRDIKINREVHGKGKFTDSIYPGPNSTKLQNPDALDDIVDLDTVFPDVDLSAVEKAFKSHPWKVWSPPVSVNVPADIGKRVKEEPKTPEEPKQEAAKVPVDEQQAKPPVNTDKDNQSKADDLEKRLRAKMEAAAKK